MQRAKLMKFKSGCRCDGNPAKMFIDKATRHRDDGRAVSAKIMLPHDPKGKNS